MAYTVTRTQSVFGNLRAVIMEVVADAATEAVPTGLSKIVGMSYAPKSMTTSNIHLYANSGVAGTATLGTIGITGCTAGDHFFITVYGN